MVVSFCFVVNGKGKERIIRWWELNILLGVIMYIKFVSCKIILSGCCLVDNGNSLSNLNGGVFIEER